MKFQAANSLEDAAQNPGGTAGEGIGLGMGFAMANQMAGMFQQQPTQQQAPMGPPPIPGAVQFFVAVGGAQSGPYGMDVLRQMVRHGTLTPDTLVWKQGMAAWTKASQVPETAGLFAPPGPPPVPPV
jgi:hypothetical protein